MYDSFIQDIFESSCDVNVMNTCITSLSRIRRSIQLLSVCVCMSHALKVSEVLKTMMFSICF